MQPRMPMSNQTSCHHLLAAKSLRFSLRITFRFLEEKWTKIMLLQHNRMSSRAKEAWWVCNLELTSALKSGLLMDIELQKIESSHRSISINEWRSTSVVKTLTINIKRFILTTQSLFQMMVSSTQLINLSPILLVTPNTSIKLMYLWRSSNSQLTTLQRMISLIYKNRTRLTPVLNVQRRLSLQVSEDWWWRKTQATVNTLILNLRLTNQDPWDANQVSAQFASESQTFTSLKMTTSFQ